MTEFEKMQAGLWYNSLGDELEDLRGVARAAVHEHNMTHPGGRGEMATALRDLFGSVGDGCFFEAPFHCAYGFNIHISSDVYFNAGVTILDAAPVRIGARTMLGPNVQIYTPQHHGDAGLRAAGQEIGYPVTLGSDVWVGGAAVLLPGVSIGDGAIIGAGSVVTHDVPAGETWVGNPARPISG
ncbi:sugar O-acetyltransferase [Pseudooceanicola sediminis]|uniref:Sugar O-acetyltransferase n=1 Tax=Pseudooceanicola sediminis TaxID=2211117 RepID=A0A399J3Z0_9RHOB|nr:sugar O-acetyltransferase [Pseudooceanicola sediminis]KAA2311503.1 sugar O-acetyltransferase [Puniceibacterium sp. HSS470]RII40055.1 sugar O-acetyltransferase [Pseudooceanicola sediminis]|tara:strand:+ start:130235 stop:130783 length:549 start_codon:yes stop_codon:yes gene_type:complete